MAHPLADTRVTRTFAGQSFQIWDEQAYEDFLIDASSRCVRTIRCAWTDRLALANAILGSTELIAGTSTFVLGVPYPDQTNYVARRVRTRGDGIRSVNPTTGMVAYERAELTVTYIPYWADQNGIGAERISFAVKPLNLSPTQSSFTYHDGTDKDLDPGYIPSLNIFTMEFTESRQLGAIPKSLIAGLVGKRNATSIFGMPADQVIFNGAESYQQFTVLGGQMVRMDYSFTYRSIPWNKIYVPGVGLVTYKLKFSVNGSTDEYPSGELNGLFS